MVSSERVYRIACWDSFFADDKAYPCIRKCGKQGAYYARVMSVIICVIFCMVIVLLGNRIWRVRWLMFWGSMSSDSEGIISA
jgi:hypothetical protein